MKAIGFEPTINSGAGWIQKEDGENDIALCQLKSTDHQSISIKQADLRILEYHADISHKVPVFAIQFLNTGEVWLMAKPEHIKIKGIKKSEQNIEFNVDKTDKKEYNIIEGQGNEAQKARSKFYEQRMKESEEMEKEQKERRKKQTWKRSSNKKV
jgi:hypothetical protein